MIGQNLPVLVPLTYLLTALLVPLAGKGRERFAFALTLFGSLAALCWSLLGLHHAVTMGGMRYHLGGWTPPIGIEFVLDPLSGFMAVLIAFVSLAVLLHSFTGLQVELPGKRVPFYSVSMLLLSGLTGIVLTGDLFNLFVFLEISSLAGYALIAVGEKRAPVAAFRYLLLGTIGATMYLIGLALIYMIAGSLNMADLAAIIPLLPVTPPLIVGFILMVVGIGVKMALFPMHSWLPDAYTYAPSTTSALIAPIGTKVAAYVLIRIMFFVFPPSFGTQQLPVSDLVSWLAAAGIIAGSILAVAQKEMKRMLAFSSVSQIGYIALGIGLGSQLGLIGAVLHMVNHAFMKGALFLVAGNMRLVIGHTNIDGLNDSLRRSMPWSMMGFSIAALSMVGIPPLAGFFSKWYLVLAAFEQSAWVFIAVILASSLLSAVYFFRILERVYLKPLNSNTDPGGNSSVDRKEVSGSMLVPTLVLSLGLLLLGVFNSVIVTEIIKRMMPAGS